MTTEPETLAALLVKARDRLNYIGDDDRQLLIEIEKALSTPAVEPATIGTHAGNGGTFDPLDPAARMLAGEGETCPAPTEGDETYYSKGKDAPWYEALSDQDFAHEIARAAQDLNDTGLGDDLDKWMPFQAMMSIAGERLQKQTGALLHLRSELALFAACCAVSNKVNDTFVGTEAKAKEWVAYINDALANPARTDDGGAVLKRIVVSLTSGGTNRDNMLSINHDELSALVKEAHKALSPAPDRGEVYRTTTKGSSGE